LTAYSAGLFLILKQRLENSTNIRKPPTKPSTIKPPAPKLCLPNRTLYSYRKENEIHEWINHGYHG